MSGGSTRSNRTSAIACEPLMPQHDAHKENDAYMAWVQQKETKVDASRSKRTLNEPEVVPTAKDGTAYWQWLSRKESKMQHTLPVKKTTPAKDASSDAERVGTKRKALGELPVNGETVEDNRDAQPAAKKAKRAVQNTSVMESTSTPLKTPTKDSVSDGSQAAESRARLASRQRFSMLSPIDELHVKSSSGSLPSVLRHPEIVANDPQRVLWDATDRFANLE